MLKNAKCKSIVICAILAIITSITACGTMENGELNNSALTKGSSVTVTETASGASKTTVGEPKGEYNEGVVLVKYDGEITQDMLTALNVQSATPLYQGAKWYSLALNDGVNTCDAVENIASTGKFDKVDYDYVMGADGEIESIDVSCNPDWDKQEPHHDAHHIPEGWKYNKDHGKEPGGSNDVIVAVIDTGVDYNHIDLRNNIWINSGEIPGNGIDDDGNGYVDDVYGWNFVGNNNTPMDDNGHGTHVAGIIAAENNGIGGVGVAYNSKVMVLKAGNSSGYFNNSDIAEAIQYAYMNGASVINMSFGGSLISIAVEEALENAYNQCVLVAAAGNDGACNNLACPVCIYKSVSYPAALPYVIGVMSTNGDCTATSSFSNYDHYPYNNIEYEVYAVGESVFSTWPNNKYATLNGTSMAAPYVSGMAALLRTAYPDRNTYSTKYLQSQIVNTGSINLDGAHTVANVYEAMTKLPTPEVNLYDYYIDDSTSISSDNNGNGVMDAGETVRLFVSLHNRGGVASNVKVTLDTMRNNDPSLTDPYFTIVNDTVNLSDIGTYSVREANETQYFEIKVSGDCPNDYLVNFNVKFSYTNGMDNNDVTLYGGSGTAQFNVSKGYYLPSTFTEDTTYTADRLYIVGSDVVIPAGITVTFEEGCEIQFYANDAGYYNTLYNSPVITVYGTLNFNGTYDNRVVVSPSERFYDCVCEIENKGCVNINGASLNNVCVWYSEYSSTLTNANVSNSIIRFENYYEYERGCKGMCWPGFCVDTIESSVIHGYHPAWYLNAQSITTSVIYNYGVFDDAKYLAGIYIDIGKMENSVIYRSENNVWSGGSFYQGTINIKESYNNVFAQYNNSNTAKFYSPIILSDSAKFVGNKFYGMYATHPEILFENYMDLSGNARIDVNDTTDQDLSKVYPYITDIHMENMDGKHITTCGKEKVKFVVDFNRDMDTTQDTKLFFGSIKPYADYEIHGEYINARQWVGYYLLTANIENGEQSFRLTNAKTADEVPLECVNNATMFSFTIDTTAAMAMNLQANATEKGIELTFVQDDYDTLLGYNIYRATSKDGNYVKLNSTILLPEESTFLDDNAKPGKTYWYTYTVVLTDFTESNPAGKVTATATDTIAPNVYHTPVNQGYMSNNLVISCTASDNVGISSVTLYYKAVGETVWKTLVMLKQSDKYSATIFGSELTLDGVEYYIVASDGRNVINKGSAEKPYTVVIKDASAISRKGDVDGDGVVTTKDALMLMQCINGDLILTDDEFKRADLNGDGILSSYEALRILQYINGNVSTLEM